MDQYSNLEAEIDNLTRVFRARNEKDFATVMSELRAVLEYAHSLESRIAALEANTKTSFVEYRTSYLGLK